MRVIAGAAKGRRLEAPDGLRVRPTGDRVREALFSILTPRLEDAHFLDLFAGTGANGIEALSRGASSCTFVDNDARSLSVVTGNLEGTGLRAGAEVLNLTLPRGLSRLATLETKYDIVFADPPYDFHDYGDLLEGLEIEGLKARDAIVVVEHDAHREDPAANTKFDPLRSARYGNTCLTFFA